MLQRRIGEVIMIGNDIRIEVLSIDGKEVRVGISAPEAVAISRQEVNDRVQAEPAGRPRR